MKYIRIADLPGLTLAALDDFITDGLRNRDGSATGFGRSYHDQRVSAAIGIRAERRAVKRALGLKAERVAA